MKLASSTIALTAALGWMALAAPISAQEATGAEAETEALAALFAEWLDQDDAAAFLACDGAGNAVGYLVAKLRDEAGVL